MEQSVARMAKKTIMRGKAIFYEIMPLASRNIVEVRRVRHVSGVCSGELHQLFDCLKKWDYDDLPCTKFRDAYMRCIETDNLTRAKEHNTAEDIPLQELTPSPAPSTTKKGGGSKQQHLTVPQFNKLMQLYPHPDCGQYPYRAIKRPPSTPYSEDTFNRKTWKGKWH